MSTHRGWKVRLEGRVGALTYDIELQTRDGPLVIIGPNGAGKSTVLRTLAGSRTGLRGRIELGGRVLMSTEHNVDLVPEARQLAYVPQGLGLFPHLSVLGNVAFGCGRGGAARARARDWLERFGLNDLASRVPATLSGGEKQRVALARALASDPVGLLLDEPLSALDIGHRRRLRGLLAEAVTQTRCPTLVVTHDALDVLAFGGDVAVIEGGRIAQRGSVADLTAKPATDFVTEFFELLEHPRARPNGSVS